jgi:hypothetical protein
MVEQESPVEKRDGAGRVSRHDGPPRAPLRPGRRRPADRGVPLG